jgi:hypothetical protein
LGPIHDPPAAAAQFCRDLIMGKCKAYHFKVEKLERQVS